MCLNRKVNIYKVDINGSNILLIKDYPEIKEFTKDYISKKYVYPGTTFFIGWDRVALKYDGIEINPYIRQARCNVPTIVPMKIKIDLLEIP